ncbi:MAG: YjjG family noncanonical pyrimidine nucleotidase [Clostridia bacterium]|nr:YjjG family noncanonical pyrimidine nucleotidase [Clostridia bacterium]
MKKYTTLYFDLDNTLLDFSAAEYKAIRNLFALHNLPISDEMVAKYSAINHTWWARFEKGEIKKEEIYSGRFREYLEFYKLEGDPIKMASDYFDFLSQGYDLIEGADKALDYIKSKGYTVCITTNGMSRTQYRRIENCSIKQYFDYIFVSEDAGSQKPEVEYFDFVMANTPEKDRSKILVIGDSMSSDILGGINFGVDTCWLNPKGTPGAYKTTYEITNIMQICDIL